MVLRDRIVFRPFDDGDKAMYELQVPLRFDHRLTLAVPVLGLGRVSVPNGIRTRVSALKVKKTRIRAISD